MKIENSTKFPVSERPAVYPELKKRIEDKRFRFNEFRWSLMGYGNIIRPIMQELREAVETGYITAKFLLEEDKGGSGVYKVKMTKKSTTDLVEATEKYLRNPRKLRNFAEAMDAELEELLTGNAHEDNYQRISDLPEN